MYDDFEKNRLIKDPAFPGGVASMPDFGIPSEPSSPVSVGTPPMLSRRNTTASSRALPSQRVLLKHWSRRHVPDPAPLAGQKPKQQQRGFTTLDSKEGFDQANSKIREAMAERGQMRRRKSHVGSDDGTEPDSSQDGSWEEIKKHT
ncbi:Sucrase/ferredoxin-like-domain-containing protein [Apiospora phragmitis]|uniref:Sucrase/ferredoxin-like-domain-containing protein n=1 Tax=Apiospora phragmitis TaxID=2905665 RepID=A0ABR1VHF4_9PEZI